MTPKAAMRVYDQVSIALGKFCLSVFLRSCKALLLNGEFEAVGRVFVPVKRLRPLQAG